MKKTQKKSITIPSLVPIIVFTLLVIGLYFVLFQKNSQKFTQLPSKKALTPSQEFKSYITEDMDMSISFPVYLHGEQSLRSITFKKDEHELYINRIATNQRNIHDFYEISSILNKRQNHIAEPLKYNGYEIIRMYKKGEVDKGITYFLYADHWVYIFSTNSPELYAELDIIVQSFRFIPD